MYFDWLTWSVWSLSLVFLGYWLFQAAREFREIIASQRKLLSHKEEVESENANKNQHT